MDLKVSCQHCGTPVAEWSDRGIVIRSRHHGAKHTTTLALADILGSAASMIFDRAIEGKINALLYTSSSAKKVRAIRIPNNVL